MGFASEHRDLFFVKLMERTCGELSRVFHSFKKIFKKIRKKVLKAENDQFINSKAAVFCSIPLVVGYAKE